MSDVKSHGFQSRIWVFKHLEAQNLQEEAWQMKTASRANEKLVRKLEPFVYSFDWTASKGFPLKPFLQVPHYRRRRQFSLLSNLAQSSIHLLSSFLRKTHWNLSSRTVIHVCDVTARNKDANDKQLLVDSTKCRLTEWSMHIKGDKCTSICFGTSER